MSNITLEEAQDAIKNLPFPEVKEGDIAWYPGGPIEGYKGHRFKYQSEEWVSYPE
tara:strand:- start:13 stop:177 length:165 start_codon:yes stop_codon:yes gene_type:complete